ncbi:MAG TPA: rRNA maturation RNase YbeY [Rhizomicrobium sp.]|nr:rRNA maturation RNase YbeY [Rhizomicrobium sp.]
MTESADITVIVEDPLWRKAASARTALKRAATLAFARAGKDRCAFSILLAGDEKLRALNASFRARDTATNVLSFPSDDMDYLGDIAIAYGVTAAEAEAQDKSFSHHAAHLAVHGVLHLLGYDHETEADALKMEPLEIEILKELKIPNPYLIEAT